MADEEPTNSDDPTKIAIHYLRSRHYRTIHADGAQFGITPRGSIQFTLFTDQAPMAEYALHDVTPQGALGKAVEEVKKEGAVREVAVNVIMDANAAASFINVFQEVLGKLRELHKKKASKDSNAQTKESTETG